MIFPHLTCQRIHVDLSVHLWHAEQDFGHCSFTLAITLLSLFVGVSPLHLVTFVFDTLPLHSCDF